MYADRYRSNELNKGSLTLSLAIVGGLVAAAMLSNTVIDIVHPDKSLTVYRVLPDPPPPPPDPRPQPRQPAKAQPQQRIDQPIPQVPSKPAEVFVARPDPGPVLTPGTGDIGTGVVIDPPKPPPPVLRGADVDGRYLRDFQPTYPTEERRAGREGVVTLRVLIGVDGRVREVERLAAASEAFWQATQTRALARWRFRPATRDGIPYETWKTMTVRFRLEEE